MNNIKAVFFDIDGTFYDHDSNCVLPETIEACKQLQKNNIKVALCSGRPKEMADELNVFDLIEWDGYIGSTGACAYNEKYDLIFEDNYTKEQLNELFSLADKNDICLISFGKYEFMTKPVNPLSQQMINEFHLKTPEIRNWNQEKLTSVCALIEKQEDIDIFSKIDGITHTSSTRYCIDFIKENVNKANAIKQMMNYWGFKHNEYIAFGDSSNDIEMLKQATIGVAMGNANDNVKKIADIVCGPSYEASIANTLKELKLI